MKLETAIASLKQISDTFQSVRGMMRKPHPNGGSYGEFWAKLVCDLDADHLDNVCYEIAHCERPLPEGDRLIADIVVEVKSRMVRDKDKLRNHEIREAGRKRPADFMHTDKIGQLACMIGASVRAKFPTGRPEGLAEAQAEAARKVEELKAWDKGGPRPSWLNE